MKVANTEKVIALSDALKSFDNYAKLNTHDTLAHILNADDPVQAVNDLKAQVMESFDGLMDAAMSLKAESSQLDDMHKAQAQLNDQRRAFEKEKSDFATMKRSQQGAEIAQQGQAPGPGMPMQPEPGLTPPAEREAQTAGQHE